MLLGRGCNADIQDELGNTPLHYAAVSSSEYLLIVSCRSVLLIYPLFRYNSNKNFEVLNISD